MAAKPEIEVILDFNGFSLQSGPLSDPFDIPSLGQEVYFDGKLWQVDRVVRTLDIPWLRKSELLADLLSRFYGKTAADRLLVEMTQSDQALAGESRTILAAPKLRQAGGQISRFIYIKLSREHD